MLATLDYMRGGSANDQWQQMQAGERSWREMSPAPKPPYLEIREADHQDKVDTSQAICPEGAPCNLTDLFPRSDSMDLINDPRFFNSSVIEKRLAAFGGLSTLGTLFVTSSVSQMYELKKNMDLGHQSGWLQMLGFWSHMVVSFMLLTAILVNVLQIFYAYRLLTSGPTGFEQASLFYLHKTMTKWRHFSMKNMQHGIGMYMFASGCVLLVKFVKDAKNENISKINTLAKDLGVTANTSFHMFVHDHNGGQFAGETVAQLKAAWNTWNAVHPPSTIPVDSHALLSMMNHTILAIAILVVIITFGCFLEKVRRAHLAAFQMLQLDGKKKSVESLALPLRGSVSSPQGNFLET